MNSELTPSQMASVQKIDPLFRKEKLEVELGEMYTRQEKMEKDQKEGQPEDASLATLRDQIKNKEYALSLLS